MKIFVPLKPAGREDIIYELFPERASCVLDIGCNEGLLLSSIGTRSKNAIGIDIRSGCFEKRYKSHNIKFINANAEQLPFKDEAFDVVIMSDVLEHIINPKNAIKEIDRVLSKGGFFLLTVPNKGALDFLDVLNLKHRFPILYHYFNIIFKTESDIVKAGIKESSFHRHYSVQELKDVLPKNFKIEIMQYHGFLLCYILDIIAVLYKKITKNPPPFLYNIAKYDYAIDYGPISCALALKFKKF